MEGSEVIPRRSEAALSRRVFQNKTDFISPGQNFIKRDKNALKDLMVRVAKVKIPQCNFMARYDESSFI